MYRDLVFFVICHIDLAKCVDLY
ncbi:hypothetical protein F383_28267 [Gossypium arboreum]|uniref:Uncharacterized protein n=1 Tax=Gossypium arboreum TaxID=29729 RepID=A0A0B0MNT7_GOSAR|nr:hypothetical protein F383_28267 [Gossypium arboreum]